MKTIRFLAALCCMLAVFTACEKNEPNDNTNGNDSVFAATGTENGHGYVDLGLSVKWATCNVGAFNPEEYGDYFAWGEIAPKKDYDWSTYKYGSDYDELTKYCNDHYEGKDGFADGRTVLDPEDDAAAVNWGGAWRIPTKDECTELLTKCTWYWTDDYNGTGVAGRIVTSNINGNSIFLPAEDNYGYYWSSSLDTDYPSSAWDAEFCDDSVGRNSDWRCRGRSVRPVCE